MVFSFGTRLMGGRLRMLAAAVVVLVIIVAAAIYIAGGGGPSSKKGGADPSGASNATAYGANLSYLDDTMSSPGVWDVLISQTTDYGVLVVGSNVANGTDRISLEVANASDGCSVSMDRDSVDIEAGDMEPVILTFQVDASASEGIIVINGTAESDPNNTTQVTLVLTIEQGNPVAASGDQLMVQYSLTDDNGTQLDSGTLPAQAGVPEAGPAGQVTYVEGFYLGLLGMEKPAGGLFGLRSQGETKSVRIPPALGYGSAEGHELQHTTLIFTLTLVAKGPLA